MANAVAEKFPIQQPASVKKLRIALAGNPNSGKTTLFNGLTGLKQKVANYPGVTVERKTATLTRADGQLCEIIDLPGLYSLVPQSLDEKIAADILNGSSLHESAPDIVIVSADVTNLARSLYLSTQIIDLGLPVILVLNMMDLAEKQGLKVDVAGLSRRLGIPVVPVVARKRQGLEGVWQAIHELGLDLHNGRQPSPTIQSVELAAVCWPLVKWFQSQGIVSEAGAFCEALRVISQPASLQKWQERQNGEPLSALVEQIRQELSAKGIPWQQAEVRLRYAAIDQICAQYVTATNTPRTQITDKIDRFLTHRLFGPIIMMIILATIFQSIYTWAEIPMEATEAAIKWFGGLVESILPVGALRDLLVNGVIAGVGAVLVFLPQIIFLFFFLAILEDSGYLARVAFIMDRFMARIGLSGQSVIPLLSSFACAIPGIMSTRTIQNPKDRLITILVAPFMSCSARLPVYTLMIGAFIPAKWFGGIFFLPGIVLLSMYFLGIVAGIVSAILLQKFVVKGTATNFVMELPVYRTPIWRFVFLRMYESAKLFVTNAGKIILAVSIVLWFLASYPKLSVDNTSHQGAPNIEAPTPQQATLPQASLAMQQIRQSFAGRLGHWIEPAIRPLGFDWKIGIGLITSFAAREVIVGTLATIYNIQDADESSLTLREALARDAYADTGKPVFTPLVAISLMVFFVLACQCMSTLAVVRKETNSWKWPIFMFFYMLVLAYMGSFITFQVGILLGLG